MNQSTENNIICNGKPTSSVNRHQPYRPSNLNSFESINMNWLLHTMYARQEFNLCKILIEKQLEENYDQEYIYFIKGLILRSEGNLHDAIKCFQECVEINSMNPENYKEIAKTLFMMGKLRQSLEAFLKSEAHLQRPDSEVYHYIGELFYRNIGKPRAGQAESKEYFQRAVQNGRQNIESYRKLAEIYVKEKNFQSAIEILENSLNVTQESADILTEIGVLYLKSNEPHNAYDKLIKAVKLDESSQKALLALSAVLQSKNDIDGALNRYKFLTNLEDKGCEIWSNIGLCFFKKQKFIAGIACLKKSQWISPLNFNVLYNLGLVLLTAQQFTSAFHVFATAINIRPGHAECYMLLGVCLKYLEDIKNASLAFERSIMMPEAIKNPLIYLNFAVFCYQLGDDKMDQARSYLGHFYKMRGTIHISKEHLKMADKLKKVTNFNESLEVNTAENSETDVNKIESDNPPTEVEPPFNENLV